MNAASFTVFLTPIGPIYLYIYVCVCVCVDVCKINRENQFKNEQNRANSKKAKTKLNKME